MVDKFVGIGPATAFGVRTGFCEKPSLEFGAIASDRAGTKTPVALGIPILATTASQGSQPAPAQFPGCHWPAFFIPFAQGHQKMAGLAKNSW